MLGLVLEGGGAKGSFQVGLLRALLDNGYKFDGAVGSSIGALNSAMLVQGDFEKSYEIWNNMEFSQLFDFEDIYAENIAKNNFDRQTIKYFFIKLKEAIKNKGLDTTKIRSLIDYYVDEEKLRKSSMDFGLMTVRAFEGKEIITPHPLFKEDIPLGAVADYIMASANFPGFKPHYINNEPYRDGGLYDNLPINMLIDKGYRDIIAVPLRGYFSFKQKPKDAGVNIQYIVPSEKPGRMLDFNNAPVNRGLMMGYYDGMRFVKGYIGELYYIDDIRDYRVLSDRIMAFPESFFGEMCNVLDVEYFSDNKVKTIYNINSKLKKLLDMKEMLSTPEIFMKLLEKVAADSELERLTMYTMKDFVAKAYEAFVNNNDKKGGKNRKKMQIDNAFLLFTKYYK